MNARRNRLLVLLAILVATLAVVGTTIATRAIGLSWDEGDYFDRAERFDAWLETVAVGPQGVESCAGATPLGAEARRYFAGLGSRRALLSEGAIAAAFPHTIYREGHPTGATLLCALGRRAYDGLRLPASGKASRRFGAIAFFGAALGAVFYRIGLSFGVWRALAAVLLIGTSPQVLGCAQFLGGDSILISSFLLAWSFYDGARYSTRRAILWGAALALAFCAKFSGFLILAPFFVAALFELRRSRRVFARLAFGVGVAFALFIALNPPLWRAPFSGLATFWRLNTTREGFNIPIWFFGNFYTPQSPPPWWNGFFWVAATTPALTLALGLWSLTPRAGRVQALRNVGFDRAFYLAIGFASIFPLVRILPGIPVHDGVRLLIASSPFLGVLAVVACVRTRARVFSVLLCVATTISVVDLARSFPQCLSFYNACVGGVGGAERLGLETTYYWDALDADFARFLRARLESARDGKDPNDRDPDGVLFGAFSSQTLEYYRLWNVFGTANLGTVSNPADVADLARYRFYVLQVRPSGFSPLDFALLKSAKPVYVKRLRPDLWRFLRKDRARAGAPVAFVFDVRDLERLVKKEVDDLPNPPTFPEDDTQ